MVTPPSCMDSCPMDEPESVNNCRMVLSTCYCVCFVFTLPYFRLALPLLILEGTPWGAVIEGVRTSVCNLAISGVKYFTKMSLVRRSGWLLAPLLPYLLLLRIVDTSSRLGGTGLLAESITSLVSLKAAMASGFSLQFLESFSTSRRAPAHVLHDFWPHQVILHWSSDRC